MWMPCRHDVRVQGFTFVQSINQRDISSSDRLRPRLTWGNRVDQSRWHRDCPRCRYLPRDGRARARGPAYFYRRPCDPGFHRHHHRLGSPRLDGYRTYLKRQHSNAGEIRRWRYALRSDGY